MTLVYWEKLKKYWHWYRSMPRCRIHLCLARSEGNDPHFRRITEDFYAEVCQRHPRLPLIRQYRFGVALYQFSEDKTYLQAVESSARRNYKKALRNGFSFAPIRFNDHLDAIWEIHRSTPVRQGEMPDEFINQRPEPRETVVSSSPWHDYPYFGVFDKDGRLVAYAGCLVAGELFMIQQIYGHYDYQSFGVVPMLIISMAAHSREHYPQTRYYNYGTFFGATETMQRFKKKFQFYPHLVDWTLDCDD